MPSEGGKSASGIHAAVMRNEEKIRIMIFPIFTKGSNRRMIYISMRPIETRKEIGKNEDNAHGVKRQITRSG